MDEVWIVTDGIYAEKEIIGVYLTIESALADFPWHTFTETRPGSWRNGRDHSQCVSIDRYAVSPLLTVDRPADVP